MRIRHNHILNNDLYRYRIGQPRNYHQTDGSITTELDGLGLQDDFACWLSEPSYQSTRAGVRLRSRSEEPLDNGEISVWSLYLTVNTRWLSWGKDYYSYPGLGNIDQRMFNARFSTSVDNPCFLLLYIEISFGERSIQTDF
jgi:hypothetical protein